MPPVHFRKTLLALAVAGVSMPAYSATLTLTNAGLSESATTVYSEAVTVSGSYTGNDDAIEFEGVRFEQNLILEASIQSSGDYASGFDLDSSEDGVATTIRGSLINRGSIAVEGYGVAAMLLDPAIIEGDLINEGTLSAKGGLVTYGSNQFIYEEGARGLDLSVTQVGGNVHNKGSITVEGERSMGIWMSHDPAGTTIIKGDLINSGTIRATDTVSKLEFDAQGEPIWDDENNRVRTAAVGINLADVSIGNFRNERGGLIEANGELAQGILFEGTQLGGDFINNGEIRANGRYASAVDITSLNGPAQVRQVINNGIIEATGAESIGFLGSFESADPRLINTGTIKGERYAIELEDFADIGSGKPLTIEHRAGLISGGEAAIFSYNGDVNLLWSGGKIVGDLLLNGEDGVSGIGQSTVRVSGDVIFDGSRIQARLVQVDSGASLGMFIGESNAAPVLTVNGNVQFAEGAEIRLTPVAADFTAQGRTYTLVQANQIDNGANNDNLDVTLASPFLNMETTVTANQVTSTVSAKGSDEVADSVRRNGGSRNAQAAIRSFAPLMGRLDENDPVFRAFAHANESEVARLAVQLSPEANGGSTSAAVSGQGLVSNTTSSRTRGARQGMNSGDTFQETGVWVQGLYSEATQDLRQGIPGYNAYSRGIAIGADGKPNPQTTLGLAYSYLDTDVNSATGNQTEVEGHAFTLYSGHELGNYFLDASMTYGFNGNESERRIAGTTAKADYDSRLLGLNLLGGYGFDVQNGLLVEPRVAARYSHVKTESYQESGSSAALRMEEQRQEIAELGAGVRFAGRFDAGQGTLEPQATFMAYHDFADDRATSTASFVRGGSSFVTQGADPANTTYEAGVGVDYLLGAFSLGLSYDFVTKSDFDADSFVAKMRYEF
ncbi:autotransporter outer membrane beta-barrel domain-containing protein [Litchfieldella xinjiangensis]|uniref:autotransporter family protein n=1 Tax=Litchfieldella xinjiangensis TaxID=1166948 RepID=UPI0005BC5B3D|nr:autotransporter outer membrane beta-barrel domain-containing protein [Halomonas xinjiangensis]